jgi:hypothetical protein
MPTILERINDSMQKRQRRLKALQIDEVSIVDRAANQHASIVLAKREEPAMPTDTAEVRKRADECWSDYVDLLAKAEGISKAKATLKAATTERGRTLLEISKAATMVEQHRLMKLGSDGINQNPSFSTPSESFDGGRVVSRTRDAPHGTGHPQPFSPYDYTAATETGDGARERYRAQWKARRRDGMDGLSARAKTFEDIGVVQLSAADVLNEEAKGNDELVAEQRTAERDANTLQRSRGRPMVARV